MSQEIQQLRNSHNFVELVVILKSIINATCPGHQEQANLILSEFSAIFDGENFEH